MLCNYNTLQQFAVLFIVICLSTVIEQLTSRVTATLMPTQSTTLMTTLMQTQSATTMQSLMSRLTFTGNFSVIYSNAVYVNICRYCVT